MPQNNVIRPIIVAIGVVMGAMATAVVTTLLETADGGTELRLTRMEDAASLCRGTAEGCNRARSHAP